MRGGVDRNPNAKTHLSNKSIKPSGKLTALRPNTHLMPKNNGEMTKHTHTKNQQMRCFAQIKIISRVMREVIYVSALSRRCHRAAERAEKIRHPGVIKVTLFYK